MATTHLTHDEHIDLQISGDLKNMLLMAAAYSGMSLSNFLVSTGRDRARQIIAENETVTFSSQDWEAFLARLDAPDEPRPHLEAAAQRYLQRRANIHTDTREL